MADPLEITFGLLASSGDPQAVDLLLAGLDVDEPAIRRRAASAMIKRGSGRGLVEMIRRLQRLDAESRAELTDNAPRLAEGLRQCLMQGDRDVRANALELTIAAECYDMVDALIALLQDRSCTQHEEVGHALDALGGRLLDRCMSGVASGSISDRRQRNAVQARSAVLSVLDHAATSYAKLLLPEPVVRGVLILADSQHVALKRLIANANPDCRELTYHLLTTDTHPGVLRLILDSLSRNYPFPRTTEVVSKRADIEFLCALLRWMPERPTVFQQKNLRNLTALAWLGDDLEALFRIPPGLQPALVNFLSATALPTSVKVGVQEWLVRHGTPEGREAASGVLDFLEEDAVQGILHEGLESEDADVQAWATSQIRPHAVPNALAMLVERLDSPHSSVREAAQDELSTFNLERVLDLFEHLDADACRRAGTLLRKIDPHCARKLERELSHAVRRRKMRGARAAHALGMAADVAPGLLVMLEDNDPLVRRTAVETLADVPLPEIREVLEERASDQSPRVREAARRSLEQWLRSFGSTALSAATSDDVPTRSEDAKSLRPRDKEPHAVP